MLKSQVLSGRRGKAGLIQSADCREDAVRISRDLLGRKVQQGNIEKLLVEERLQVEEELSWHHRRSLCQTACYPLYEMRWS